MKILLIGLSHKTAPVDVREKLTFTSTMLRSALTHFDSTHPQAHLEDVREGVIASRIAAHAADIAKGVPGAIEWDHAMSRARKALDWEKQIALSVNPERARKLREAGRPCEDEICSMCGEYCAIKLVNESMGFK